MAENSIAFVGGLHRSGTSLLARAIAAHPDASTFSDTGFPEDEGQFLQSVYPIARVYGGPGRFGFDARSHLTERSSLVTEGHHAKLLSEWGPYWDMDKLVLLEKSPPNLLKLRFLQALFPQATLIVIIRHPLAVSLATQKWNRASTHSLIRHWLVCHELFLADAPCVCRLIMVRYEDLIVNPTIVTGIQKALGLSPTDADIHVRSGLNERYFDSWRRGDSCRRGSQITQHFPAGFRPTARSLARAERYLLARRFEQRVRRFGYSLTEPERLDVTPVHAVERLLTQWRE